MRPHPRQYLLTRRRRGALEELKRGGIPVPHLAGHQARCRHPHFPWLDGRLVFEFFSPSVSGGTRTRGGGLYAAHGRRGADHARFLLLGPLLLAAAWVLC